MKRYSARTSYTRVPGAITVGDRVWYDGALVTVTETDISGEYGSRVAIRLDDGPEMITTPGLDHRWNRDRDDPLPPLSELLYDSSGAARAHRQYRRQCHLAQCMTSPHGLCGRSLVCLEHKQDNRVPSCKGKRL